MSQYQGSSTSQSVRYVAFYLHEPPTYLGRIIRDHRLWGERLVDGRWVRDDRALDALFHPDQWVELIDDDQAETLAEQLGIKLEIPGQLEPSPEER